MLSIACAILGVVLLLAQTCDAVIISNTVVRKDVDGLVMDTHDGNIMQWEQGGLYYFYSMGYTNCTIEHGKIPPQECPGIYRPYGGCGFRVDHALRVYSSPDLQSWTLVAEDALPYDSRPYGIYFRPKVIYNPTSKRYLLWINHLANASIPLVAYPEATYIVASARTPDGPFEVINNRVNLAHTGAGDFDLLVTTDPQNGVRAFVSYDSWETDHVITVEQLNGEFTDSLGLAASAGLFSPPNVEAPILFQRGGECTILCLVTHVASAKRAVARICGHPETPWALGRLLMLI